MLIRKLGLKAKRVLGSKVFREVNGITVFTSSELFDFRINLNSIHHELSIIIL